MTGAARIRKGKSCSTGGQQLQHQHKYLMTIERAGSCWTLSAGCNSACFLAACCHHSPDVQGNRSQVGAADWCCQALLTTPLVCSTMNAMASVVTLSAFMMRSPSFSLSSSSSTTTNFPAKSADAHHTQQQVHKQPLGGRRMFCTAQLQCKFQRDSGMLKQCIAD